MSKMLYVDYCLEKDQKECLDNLLGKCGTIKGNGKVTYYLEEKQIKAIGALINKEGFIYYDDNDFDLSDGCRYYTINALGGVGSLTWHNDYTDKNCMDIGNVFKTEREAYFMAERLRVLAKMRKFALPRKWIGSAYYILAYHAPSNDIRIIEDSVYKTTDIVFRSSEEATNCINSVGKEKIIKYYFGVEK